MNSAFWLLAVPLMCVWHFAGEQRCLNSELWHACAGPLVSLPMVGSRVVYFPQGHSEQVGHLLCPAVSWNKLGIAEFVDFRFCKQRINRITWASALSGSSDFADGLTKYNATEN